MKEVALVTYQDYPTLSASDQLLTEPLTEYGIQPVALCWDNADVDWQQFWFEVTQPEVLAEAVTGHGFNPAVFAVGIGVVNCPVDEVIQACQYAQGAGQPVIARAVRLVIDIAMLTNTVPRHYFPSSRGSAASHKQNAPWSGHCCRCGD